MPKTLSPSPEIANSRFGDTSQAVQTEEISHDKSSEIDRRLGPKKEGLSDEDWANGYGNVYHNYKFVPGFSPDELKETFAEQVIGPDYDKRALKYMPAVELTDRLGDFKMTLNHGMRDYSSHDYGQHFECTLDFENADHKGNSPSFEDAYKADYENAVELAKVDEKFTAATKQYGNAKIDAALELSDRVQSGPSATEFEFG